MSETVDFAETWDALIPTDYLIVEVLSARVRCGESCWTFPARHRAAVTRLQSLGFVGSWKEASVENHILVWPGEPLLDWMRAHPYRPVSAPTDAAVVGSEVREEWGVLLGEISLYVEWRWVTSQLTTAQKELWADAVDAWSARLNDGDPADTTPADRWWRS